MTSLKKTHTGQDIRANSLNKLFSPLTKFKVDISDYPIDKQSIIFNLEEYLKMFSKGAPKKEIITSLFNCLQFFYQNVDQTTWVETIKPLIQSHPIINKLHLDPCTKHSFDKPRGYPGDATLLDYFYGKNNTGNLTSESKEILDIIRNRPASQAVQNRARKLSTYIDNIAAKKTTPKYYQ